MARESKKFISFTVQPSERQRKLLRRLIKLVSLGGELSNLPRNFQRAVLCSQFLRLRDAVIFNATFSFRGKALYIKNFGRIPIPEGIQKLKIKSISLSLKDSLMIVYCSLEEVIKK